LSVIAAVPTPASPLYVFSRFSTVQICAYIRKWVQRNSWPGHERNLSCVLNCVFECLQWEIPHDASGKVPRGEKAPGTLKYDQKYLNEKFTDFVSIMKQFMKVCVLGGRQYYGACPYFFAVYSSIRVHLPGLHFGCNYQAPGCTPFPHMSAHMLNETDRRDTETLKWTSRTHDALVSFFFVSKVVCDWHYGAVEAIP
jgi:hypothetical protein